MVPSSDQLIDKCSTQEFQTIKDAFNKENIILTESNGWVSTTEVFLTADEEDAPGAALVHPSVRHLAIWLKVGVANRPTVDLAIDWLANLEPGQSLTADELRRVRSLMPRYPERIWSECGHWLNLEGEWTPTVELVYSLTMQTLVAWKHLFKPIKQKTADLQKLSADVCDQHPFATLRSLAQSIEDRFEDHFSGLPDPQKKPWLHALGSGLRRLVLDDHTDTQRVRELANRLTVTHWQPASGLQTVPYIDGIPAGTPRRIDVLWKDSLLYVEDRSTAKMAKAVAQEQGRVFNNQEVADAIKLCYDRSPEFVLEYLEENFKLMPEVQIDPISETRKPKSNDDQSEVTTQEEKRPSDPISDQNEPQRPGKDDIANDDEGNTVVRNEQSEDADFNLSSDSGELGDHEDEDEFAPAPRRSHPRPAKPKLIERFAAANGYAWDNSEGRFNHKNGGWLERVSGNSSVGAVFAFRRVLQCYWVKRPV